MISRATQPTVTNLSILFFATFLLRALVFQLYIRPNKYYHAPDSLDYHSCTLGLTFKGSFCYLDHPTPIYWRTPGYPWFLKQFYAHHRETITSIDFSDAATAQQAALWFQIFLCSFIPLILLFLALALTRSFWIAWMLAWISCLHVGFILNSMTLMTDGLGSILFYLFLYLFYLRFSLIGETARNKYNLSSMIGAAAALALYTWLRPMGEKVDILMTILLLFSGENWKTIWKKIILFGGLFFGLLSPWYIRNYHLTDSCFFWPSGLHLNLFSTSKIVRRVKNISIEKAHQQQSDATTQLTRQRYKEAFIKKTKVPCGYLIHQEIAMPWIRRYPGYFLYDFFVQILCTAFDLYSLQLMHFFHNTYHYEPLERYITEDIPDALYSKPLPISSRLICWLEFFFMLLMWTGIILGFWKFIIAEFISLFRKKSQLPAVTFLWLKLLPLAGAVIAMGGFFGCARLRLPVEPLLLILSLSFWYTVIVKRQPLSSGKIAL
ncbi:hypothetical protein JW872_00885 [Candidatus Babeliales bacterium]|nr:hypothetical protein [Candidatus Babeliales bacterium]